MENNPIHYLLRRPLEATPGQKFHYNSSGTNLLEESTRSWIYPTELGIGNGYGYQWWLNDFAPERGEQFMFIIPDESMIVMFFREYYNNSPQLSIPALMIQYIFKAFQ